MQHLSCPPHNDPRQSLSRMVAAGVKPSDEQFGIFRLPCRLSRTTRGCRSTAGAQSGMCVNSSNTTRGMSGSQTCRCELAFSQASLESSRTWFPWLEKELMYDTGSVSFSFYIFMLVRTPTHKVRSFGTHLHDFRLPPRSTCGQRCSGLLRS
jgi:ferredoxin-thioredoxin reductase catalytic subunit